jgi:hypothetical protein
MESLWLYIFCGFHRELVYCYLLDSTRIMCMLLVHISLGGAFPKRHRANCGVIAIIRKVPILGRHTPRPGHSFAPVATWNLHTTQPSTLSQLTMRLSISPVCCEQRIKHIEW